MTDYNLKNIRKLVTEIYNLEELRQLTYEEFREVYEDYSEVRKSELVRRLIEHAERKGLLAKLLSLTEVEAPAKYAEFEGQLIRAAPDPVDPLDSASAISLSLTATPPKIKLGEPATWQAVLYNSGQTLYDVLVRQGRTLLDEPFELASHETREFIFSTQPTTKGRKQKKVSLTGVTPSGRPVRVEAVATVQVIAEPTSPVSTAETRPTAPELPAEPAASPDLAKPDRFILEKPFEMTLLRIPPGEFMMGSDVTQDETARPNEQPQHRVYLSDFYIGQYPIINAHYATFIEATGYQAGEQWTNKGIWFLSGVQFPSGDRTYPATYISWHDAAAFCRWLSQESGLLFRLPTEAEWEKAARGTQGQIYPWGNDWDHKRLNTIYSQLNRTSPVGRFSPHGDSPFGVADMSGNVWEWCADWFDEQLYRRRTEGPARTEGIVRDPTGPAGGSRRVLRGGSWSGDRYVARSPFRYRYDPSGRRNDYGFRVVTTDAGL